MELFSSRATRGPAFVGLDLDEIRDSRLQATDKGVPEHLAGVRIADIASCGWTLRAQQSPSPALVLRRDALLHNVRTFADLCRERGVAHAPHGKTTMAPQLFDAQLRAGAWGITAATVDHVRVYRRFAVPRVMYANQLVRDDDISWLADQREADGDFEVVSWVDSSAAVDALATVLRQRRPTPLPWPVLVEIGYAGGRCGTRSLSDVRDVLAAVARTHGMVKVVGVAAFEGFLPVSSTASADRALVSSYLATVRDAATLVNSVAVEGPTLVTAGGSAAVAVILDELAARLPTDATFVLRSGCYVTHDHGTYARSAPLPSPQPKSAGDGLLPALELRAHVQSTPEKGLAILGVGRRDTGHDAGFPVPLHVVERNGKRRPLPAGATIARLDDQHAYLAGVDEVSVGDLVVCGISHPCTTFDKWRVIPVIDADDFVVDVIRTYF